MRILKEGQTRILSDLVGLVQNPKTELKTSNFHCLAFEKDYRGLHLGIDTYLPQMESASSCFRFEHVLQRVRGHFKGITFQLIEIGFNRGNLIIRLISDSVTSNLYPELVLPWKDLK